MEPRDLVVAAAAARVGAYAPYSGYAVGAAVSTGSGRMFTGVNVENASYGLAVCAERAAVFAAVSAGERTITAMAVATEDGATPCGACRQVLWEFGRDARVYVARLDGSYRETSVAALLPEAFRVPGASRDPGVPGDPGASRAPGASRDPAVSRDTGVPGEPD